MSIFMIASLSSTALEVAKPAAVLSKMHQLRIFIAKPAIELAVAFRN
jgi:hypothetical protein